jgi:hypothetical protein
LKIHNYVSDDDDLDYEDDDGSNQSKTQQIMNDNKKQQT